MPLLLRDSGTYWLTITRHCIHIPELVIVEDSKKSLRKGISIMSDQNQNEQKGKFANSEQLLIALLSPFLLRFSNEHVLG